ncbi:hypothetical protein LXA41_17870, partial [Erwinia amylovora]|uniref:hypothetical protein n=1 Tax=Erwinia amylovora TaxID=552 RepID=UPI0020C14C3A
LCIPVQPRAVLYSDITVVVLSRSDSAVIREALYALAFPSVFVSIRDSVFSTPDAREMLWFFQAVLAPEQECFCLSSVATRLFCMEYLSLD